jgi:hypothetical protein
VLTSEFEATPEIVTNGTAGAAASGPRVRRREVWAELPTEAADSYPDFRVKLWANFRRSLLEEITSGDNDRVSVALHQIVLEHNGWCDEDGEPYPPASDAAFWDAIPTELASLIIIAIQREATRLPNSLLRTNTSSNGGSRPRTNGA